MDYEIRELSREEFPSPLLEIPQPPKKLFLAGTLPSDETIFLSVVGSRKHSSYGADACAHLISGLAGYPISIVSGLALGIDSIAHTSAINANLRTIAVPGSGLNPRIIYPRSNLRLAEKIIDSGGALLSEFEPLFRATTWSFPQRNRIMAGLSRAVLIVEAEERSGTLITARLATEYNRDVYVVPNGIFSPGSKGSNKLLRLGAYPIAGPEDILDLFGLLKEGSPSPQASLFDMSAEEVAVFELLSEPLERDEIFRRSDLDASEGNALLSVMEIKGIIIERGGMFRRN